jgi:hypothetical protein
MDARESAPRGRSVGDDLLVQLDLPILGPEPEWEGFNYDGYVALSADSQMLVGEHARRQAAANAEGTATAPRSRLAHALRKS